MKKILILITTVIFSLYIIGCTKIFIVVPPPEKQPMLKQQTVPVQPSTDMHCDYDKNSVDGVGLDGYYHPNPLVINPASPTITYGQVTLVGLNLNDHGNKIIATPGESIPATAMYSYNCPTCHWGSINQIIIGIANEGAQTCIYDNGVRNQGTAYFDLIAPQKPGTYEIRFRYAQAFDCKDAVSHWWNVNHAPDESATVGTIIVR